MLEQDVGSWGRPELLAGLWLLAPLLVLVVFVLRSRVRALARLALAGIAAAPSSRRLHGLRLGLSVAGIALCLVALAQPRWGYQWRELKQEGLDIAVILDVSRSMDAQDVAPSRMERARRELTDLAGMLRGDRIALVLAAGGAYPRMPLTQDYDAFQKIVHDSDTSTLRAQGTDLGRAIEVASKTLGEQGAADRTILILSDGEDQVGKAQDAAKVAAADGIHIYTLGIGTTEGAPIPLAEGGFKKDQGNKVILTRLDRAQLQELARIGAGAYADSVAGTSDLQALYGDGIRGGLKTAEQGVRREKQWNERFQWPLGAGLLLLLVASGLRPPAARRVVRTRDRAAAALLAGLLLLGGSDARAAGDAASPAASPAAGPAKAGSPSPVDQLLAQQAQHPDDLALAERLGQALYQAGDYNRAEDVLDGVAERSLDPAQRQRARSNAALSAYRGGRLTQAVEDWDRVVQESAEPASTKTQAQTNADAVRKELAARMKQDQQKKQDQQQGQQQPDDGTREPDKGEGDTGQQQQPQPGQQAADPQQQQQADAQQGDEQQDDTGGAAQAQGAQQDAEAQQDGGAAQGATAEGQGDTGQGDGQVRRPGSMSEKQASRLVDGVKEGSPHVVVDPESRGGKDW